MGVSSIGCWFWNTFQEEGRAYWDVESGEGADLAGPQECWEEDLVGSRVLLCIFSMGPCPAGDQRAAPENP